MTHDDQFAIFLITFVLIVSSGAYWWARSMAVKHAKTYGGWVGKTWYQGEKKIKLGRKVIEYYGSWEAAHAAATYVDGVWHVPLPEHVINEIKEETTG